MITYDTLTEALTDLKKRGFTTDFNIAFDAIKCSKTDTVLKASEFEITEHYRFEGDTDPADESVLYAVESKDGSIKGTLISAYGAYSESVSDELIQKLSVH